ncbi:MAG: SDR family oxidoreductase [Burkholderiales bacterium]|nr:SDR family oxidoreductase [Burkholderiales bacterium]
MATDREAAPLAGRVALVTGANTGIGRVTAIELARRGARVVIACRSAARAAPVLAELRAIDAGAVGLELELGDFDSVRRCAQRFLELGLPLHVLVNNAGVAGDRGLTPSGFERAFGVNHLGHFLLTTLLLERLQASAPARIVNVASRAHVLVSSIDWDALRRPTRSLTGVAEYGVSKLCNVLFSAELARRLQGGSGVTSHALHPGVVASEVWRHAPWPLRVLNRLRTISNEEGALTTLHCATADEAGRETGLYYDRCRPRQPSRLAQDSALAAELWRRSEDWVR